MQAWVDPKISSALETVGISKAGARDSVTQARHSSLDSIGRIVEDAPRQYRGGVYWQYLDLRDLDVLTRRPKG